MNKAERIKVVRAMETLAHCINDEDIFDSWLMCGVADEDIKDDTPDEYIGDTYTDDDTYRDLLDLFVRLMAQARKSGGLTSDGIVTKAG